ncbi:FliM/FliN family flagellar motor switch protein [Sphingomonas xinjiangensis]|uniref:Flagellar motor switch/type III secretory pathway protein FliN n=1 Tax=Sphingomonas xinjiangensis TaxID=643568 RepID=A0A840YQ83_9SPHN|nr:FliM/FliN family flagellar motor switch protein [Sphingomonas xinjiangensis]MBB5710911.1 flagellar motor switch/type III secretory pathway protein FliN [Sphingomonas xinjiangensis]
MATALRMNALVGLPKVDPEVSAFGQAISRLLEASGFTTQLVPAPGIGPWFSCLDGSRFRLAEAMLHPERIAEASALLDTAEPLLSAVESTLGLALEPENIIADLGDNSAVVGFARDHASGEIALPLDHPLRAQWEVRAAALPPLLATMPMLAQLMLRGPRLPIAEAGELAPGDLVLISARPGAMLDETSGQFDFFSGTFTPHPQGAPMNDASSSSRDFAVPLTLRLPERMVSAASLADLRPGMSLPLGPVTEGMQVDLLVAGRLLAHGELVQLGDRFAVLIDHRAAMDDTANPAEPGDVAENAA